MKSLLLTGAVLLVSAGLAQANDISGSLWAVPESVAQDATPGNVPVTTPDVTFNVNGSGLDFNATNATVAAWLASGGATGIVENTAGTLSSRMDNNVTGHLFDFMGDVTVTNGETFTVTHDDGLTLIIGGLTVINAPGPTTPTITTETYTGPSGNLPFNLVYAECCEGPAVLQISLPLEPVPGPIVGAGLPGLVAGCMALLGLGRFRRRSSI